MIDDIIHILERSGAVLTHGLSASELRTIEERFQFKFPPDLRCLLTRVLPISSGFPDWRAGSVDILLRELIEPITGIVLSVGHGEFWLSEWGDRPLANSEAAERARLFLQSYPKMIPVYGHRYIPIDPSEEGNPVFSVVGPDIIIYGANLLNFFSNEFSPGFNINYVDVKNIRGWSKLL